MADRMLVAFGKYLKILRDRRKMSLSDVVTLTKSYPEPVGKGYLSRVERGLARVGFSKMVALSRAYEVSLDALGEKLALDLEVDALKNAPSTSGKSFAELMDEGSALGKRGLKWHCYAAIRDGLSRAGTDPLHAGYESQHEQVTRAALSHGIAARSLGRYAVALSEFWFVRQNLESLSKERVSVVFEQSAIVKMQLGEFEEARVLAERAVELANDAPLRTSLGDALSTRASLAYHTSDIPAAISGHQEAFTAYKTLGRQGDCARTMNNIAQCYFDVRRFRAARRALGAADRLATELGDDSVRARSRILLGEIESLEGNAKQAADHWHDAMEIARRTRDSVVHFKAEFQVFKLSINQGNLTAANALGRRLDRAAPWIPRSEPEVAEFLRLFALHRKPKRRGVANAKPEHPLSETLGV